MTIAEMRDSIAYEAKIADIDALGGWIEATIKEVWDSYTALTKHDELFMPGIILLTQMQTDIVQLPADLQHIDLNNVRYSPGGDRNRTYILDQHKHTEGTNTGLTRYFTFNAAPDGTRVLNIWPFDEVPDNDEIIIDYWRKGHTGVLGSQLLPTQLEATVRLEVVARANTFADSKQSNLYLKLSKDAHTRSYGVTNLPDQNQ